MLPLPHIMRRSKQAASSEWSLICATHNLPKLRRSGKAKFRRIGMRIRPEIGFYPGLCVRQNLEMDAIKVFLQFVIPRYHDPA